MSSRVLYALFAGLSAVLPVVLTAGPPVVGLRALEFSGAPVQEPVNAGSRPDHLCSFESAPDRLAGAVPGILSSAGASVRFRGAQIPSASSESAAFGSRRPGVVGGLLVPPGAAPSRAPGSPARGSSLFADSRRDFNTENYAVIDEPGFVSVSSSPLSTFSIDVDTAAYSNVRRFLNDGSLPPADAVRIEELINYFDYDHPAPEAGAPFGVFTEIADSPWAPNRRLAYVALRSAPVETADLPPNSLIFLVDVSGSMRGDDKLPLLKESLTLLAGELRPQDQVAIVAYSGAASVVLGVTSGADKPTILEALSGLRAGGSTAGARGVCLTYDLARKHFIEDGNNRVVLATDGDFNVGASSEGELVELIEWERESGVYLSVLGFGTGNLQDAKMEQLADRGNGNYAYIDSLREGRRVLVEQMGATLLAVAADVKLQVEFNPARVKGYRLIGYENRSLRNEEFNDDSRDAGELGAGGGVTALYEIVPAGSGEPVPGVDPLRYREPPSPTDVGADEVLTVRVRYKEPGESRSRLLTRVLTIPAASGPGPSRAFEFASAVAEFGMLLRGSPYRGGAAYDRVFNRAVAASGPDHDGRRKEFLSLVRTAEDLSADLSSFDGGSAGLTAGGESRLVRVLAGERLMLRLEGFIDGDVVIDAVPVGGFDPVLHLYRRVGAGLVAVDSDDDGGAEPRAARIEASLDAGVRYSIGVEDYGGSAGSAALSFGLDGR